MDILPFNYFPRKRMDFHPNINIHLQQDPMLYFYPFHLSAITVSPLLPLGHAYQDFVTLTGVEPVF
ncbi:hypothetical protein [Elizabethkingia anophelis]|uniref:hypothetical protein n=1 Tax=Elizabethkingia anophelis TaxID=1117645 RepID=UPI001861AFD4|nr:hypothetical protein [Elizabethkingia anophelis]QNV11262.1 hypothetical protein EIY88_18835 [Elizabethkingia anophelis]UTG53891.1 hypothetical protein J2O05_18950 [Elizabethkingia anophelis]